MNKRKPLGPVNIQIKVWVFVGDKGIKYLTELINRILTGESMPREWRNHTMKLWERTVTDYLGKIETVLFDKNLPVKIKGKIYRICVRPAMVYGMENCTTSQNTRK
jgi:hypothetical protein